MVKSKRYKMKKGGGIIDEKDLNYSRDLTIIYELSIHEDESPNIDEIIDFFNLYKESIQTDYDLTNIEMLVRLFHLLNDSQKLIILYYLKQYENTLFVSKYIEYTLSLKKADSIINILIAMFNDKSNTILHKSKILIFLLNTLKAKKIFKTLNQEIRASLKESIKSLLDEYNNLTDDIMIENIYIFLKPFLRLLKEYNIINIDELLIKFPYNDKKVKLEIILTELLNDIAIDKSNIRLLISFYIKTMNQKQDILKYINDDILTRPSRYEGINIEELIALIKEYTPLTNITSEQEQQINEDRKIALELDNEQVFDEFMKQEEGKSGGKQINLSSKIVKIRRIKKYI